MSWNPNNNTFIMNPQNNNPWGNQDQMQPSGQNWQQVFGNPMNSNPGGASTMPVGQPDIYGGGGLQQFGQNNYQQFQPLSFSPDNPGGSYQPTQFNQLNPIGQGLGQGGFGSTDQMNRGGGFYGNAGLQPVTPTPAAPPPGMGMSGANPDAGYPKFDPAYLSQVQGALESPNGPYANRQPGDYAPPDAPENVRNPQTQADWQARFYYFAAHPEALANPSAPGAGLQSASVPWQQFAKDVYSDRNANRSFNELSGVVDDARLKQAQDMYGWQLGPSGLTSNDAAVAQASQMKQAHPEYSYQVYQRPDGTFGIAARELQQSAQQQRGFYAPGMAPKPAVTPHPVSSTYRGSGASSKPSYTATQIAQQQALGKYGAGALNWAAQHMPTPTMPNGSRGQTNSAR